MFKDKNAEALPPGRPFAPAQSHSVDSILNWRADISRTVSFAHDGQQYEEWGENIYRLDCELHTGYLFYNVEKY